MSFADLLGNVVSRSLCASCGVCELACPKDLIRFAELEPILSAGTSAADCGTCNDCVAACPGQETVTPLIEKSMFGRTRRNDERWLGIFSSVYGGRAVDPDTFARSASGGSATALLQTAMSHLGLDVVLVMGRSEERPWRSAPALCSRPEDLVENAQSTYQMAPYLGALKAIRTRDPKKRIGIVGIACYIQGLRKLQRLDTDIGQWARDQVLFALEIACSSSTLPRGTETIITDLLRVDLENVESLKYREGEYPGAIVVRTTDGLNHTVPFWQAVRHFADNKAHRCLSCGDWMSGLADVSVSDGDPNIFKGSLGLNQIAKHGRVFVRTPRGAEVFERARDIGALEAWPIELSGLNLGLERKRNRRADYELRGCALPDSPIPGYEERMTIVPDATFLAVPDQVSESAPPENRASSLLRAGPARLPAASAAVPAIPGDKSISHRALLLAALLPGRTRLANLNRGDAVTLLISALQSLGVACDEEEGGVLSVGSLPTAPLAGGEPVRVDLGPSSAAARMLIGLLAGRGFPAIVDGNGTLRSRPMDWIVDPLRELGAKIEYLGRPGGLPVRIASARLRGGEVRLSVGSAQARAAVLFAAFAAGVPVVIQQSVHSRDHELRLMRRLGAEIGVAGNQISFRPDQLEAMTSYTIPRDPSAAAYVVAAHFFQRRGDELRIEGLCLNPTRIGFFETLRDCGVDLHYESVSEDGSEPVGTVMVGRTGATSMMVVDDAARFHAMIDEIPLAAAVAARLPRGGRFAGLEELRFKETDRIRSTCDLLRALGAQVEANRAEIWIRGGADLRPGRLPSFGDHRIAMTAAAAACGLAGKSRISDGGCFRTSFPEFVEVMRGFGFDVEEEHAAS